MCLNKKILSYYVFKKVESKLLKMFLNKQNRFENFYDWSKNI